MLGENAQGGVRFPNRLGRPWHLGRSGPIGSAGELQCRAHGTGEAMAGPAALPAYQMSAVRIELGGLALARRAAAQSACEQLRREAAKGEQPRLEAHQQPRARGGRPVEPIEQFERELERRGIDLTFGEQLTHQFERREAGAHATQVSQHARKRAHDLCALERAELAPAMTQFDAQQLEWLQCTAEALLAAPGTASDE